MVKVGVGRCVVAHNTLKGLLASGMPFDGLGAEVEEERI